MITLAQSMQQFPWPKLIFLFLFIGISVVSWVMKQLQEQRQKRRVEMERQRRDYEALRTGRGPMAGRGEDRDEEPSQAARQTAARRQAQLDALKRRQARGGAGESTPAGGGVSTGPVSAGPATAGPGQSIDINLGGVILRIPGSTGPTVPGTRGPRPGGSQGSSGGRAGSARPKRAMTPEQAAEFRRRQTKKANQERQAEYVRREDEQRRQAEARRAERARLSEEGVSDEDPVRRLVPGDPDAAPVPTKVMLKRTVAALRGPSLREALILREILGPPISMR